jgi:hypothetical protein
MESPVVVLYVLAALAGLVALEVRRSSAALAALGAAFALFAAAMFVMGAIEVAVGAIVAGVAVLAVLRWGFKKTVELDTLPALPGGGTGALVIACVVLFVVVLFLVARPYFGMAPVAAEGGHAGGSIGLLREVLVVVAALAAVWAMLRKSGRGEE